MIYEIIINIAGYDIYRIEADSQEEVEELVFSGEFDPVRSERFVNDLDSITVVPDATS